MNESYNKAGALVQTNPKKSYDSNPVRALVHHPGFALVIFALSQPFLALAMHSSSLIATALALITLVIGLWFALISKDTCKVGYVAAYIAGAEVLWRMTDAQIFWEAGKYFTILILGIAFLRIKPWKRSGPPIVYFVLLSISILIMVMRLGVSSTAREAISFNLSGPLALMVCALYFSHMTVDQPTIRRLVWWIIIPILGIATLSVYGILTSEVIVFTNESNFATSGGFGPNQVSALLGLGGGLALLLFLMEKRLALRSIALVLALGFLVLSVITFSRGGFYNAIIMVGLALAHYLRNPRGRMVAIIAIFLLGIVGGYLIFPRLNTYTGGMLAQRFSDLDTTLREKIAQADLELWYANPIFGVGPGLSMAARYSLLGSSVAAHTEYTRILAEHGLFGLLALFVMLLIALQAYLRAPTIETKTWVAALLAWPLMEMSHAAMRVVAISFMFGLALVNWQPKSQIPNDSEKRK